MKKKLEMKTKILLRMLNKLRLLKDRVEFPVLIIFHYYKLFIKISHINSKYTFEFGLLKSTSSHNPLTFFRRNNIII